MNLLDYIIIIIMTYLILMGILRGFVREIFLLAGIVLGVWLGILFQPRTTDFLRSYLPDGNYLPLLSIALLFAVTFIVCNILGRILKFLFKKAFLGGLDRVLGAVLAVIKGIFISYIILIALTFFLPAKTPLIAGSSLAPWIIKSYQSMAGLISPDYLRGLKKRITGDNKNVGKITFEKSGKMVAGHE